ncbi:CapA family protein [Caldibacillus lycopersici]|uniref:CapA family protein n=1 Tax=Perspicuibacillus lycopersici TaxID=1325689 RepID=A0AAE3IUJ3_9BACI|nr:CapA family protein [Perspicuibacillus lycopersici]MCU9614692.1 CapA family protein [Perspicuibacillus lycopersici]
MLKNKYLYIILTIFALFLILGGLYQFVSAQNEQSKTVHTVTSNGTRTIAAPQYKTWQETVTIGAIGDILIHDWVYQDAQTEDGYDFKPMFQYIRDTLLQPDILLANQESLLGGAEIGVSSYPSFNSPYEVGDALIDSGVDIVSTANNHTLDRGEKAILNAINYYERVGQTYVGHYKDVEDQNTLRIINKKGINFAFLSYTYGTNGIPVPEGKDYLVNLIDLDKMKEEIIRAKKEADVVVMSIHWGNEYQRVPSEEQKYIAQELASYGVDIIFGHHPHVLQPMEWIEVDGHKTFVVYSLGNFLSGQMWDYKDIGGVAEINVTKTVTNSGVSIELSEPTFLPTYVSNTNLHNYRVVPLQDAGNFGLSNASEKQKEIIDHMFQWIVQ